MKKLLILGAGTGGTIMANKMRKDLPRDEWEISIITEYKTHYYQPGFLFIPFGMYKEKDVIKSVNNFIPQGVNLVFGIIDKIEGDQNQITLKDGEVIRYDILIIATGTKIFPQGP